MAYGIARRGADDAAGFVSSPQDILDAMNAVERAAAQLDADVLGSPLVQTNAKWVAGWGAWLAEWRVFYAAHLPWWRRLNGTVHDQVDAYVSALSEWRRQFKALGGTPTGPALEKPGGGLPSLGDITNLIVVGVIAYVVVKNL